MTTGVREPAPAPPPAPLPAADQLGHAFKGAMAAVRRLRGRETQAYGPLSYARYGLLFGLAAEPELPTSRLASIADLSPATATEMLDHLEADGLITRRRSERDKRVVLVSLTPSGEAIVAERRALFEPRFQEALAGFSDQDLRTAAGVLERLRDMFDRIESR